MWGPRCSMAHTWRPKDHWGLSSLLLPPGSWVTLPTQLCELSLDWTWTFLAGVAQCDAESSSASLLEGTQCASVSLLVRCSSLLLSSEVSARTPHSKDFPFVINIHEDFEAT